MARDASSYSGKLWKYSSNSSALKSDGVTRIETYEIGKDGTWTLIETKE